MILQALKEYYDRKDDIAPLGWELKEFPFLVVIDLNGNFECFEDTRQPVGKKLRAKGFLVPSLGEAKGNGIKANLLWENAEYMFGIPMRDNSNPDRVAEQHSAFRSKICSLANGSNPGSALAALKAFVIGIDIHKIQTDPRWQEVKELGQALLLAISGRGVVTNIPEVRNAVNQMKADQKTGCKALCLVSGEMDIMAILEPPVRGVQGASTMGAHLVSVNNKVTEAGNGGATPSFASFMKEQGANSPIGKNASAAYTTALNTLLGKDSRQKMLVGDATTVFWSAKETAFEAQVCDFFDPPDDPDRLTEAVKSLFKAIDTGAFSSDEGGTRFYVLGLAPNAARISVRFWHCGTVAEMAGRIRQHFADTLITHGPKDKDHLPLWKLLVSTAPLGKSENIPPNLAGDTMRAILEGLPYPETLLQACVRRCRVEHEIPHARAALIKACINRKTRSQNPNEKEELKMSLDPTNTNIGYRLGRLFAVLEKIQIRAATQNGGKEPSATIRDKFYGAASSSPVTVFGNLMRLKNHHLSKLENVGARVNFEKLISEVMLAINDFPAHLSLADQGRFAIGYYHQMQDSFTKKSDQE